MKWLTDVLLVALRGRVAAILLGILVGAMADARLLDANIALALLDALSALR